jgi:hypothetical protein
MIRQEEYISFLAKDYYDAFFELGHAIAGHNGPHGHEDTPVRNTAHYLIIYSYLYKKEREEKYLELCKKFADYLCDEQAKTVSGAIQCMVSDQFDHLNGLIGQAWVVDALLYYYEISKEERCLETARKIYLSQPYDKELHLWRRTELDGTDIGPDTTYNHQVWFAACAQKLEDYCEDLEVHDQIVDFLTKGADRDFRLYSDGLLYHSIGLPDKSIRRKLFIKTLLTPFAFLNPQKMDRKYIVKAYHIFDMYGFAMLKEKYGDLPLFSSDRFRRAVECALDITAYDRRNGVPCALKKGSSFNVFGYSYNAPAFEYPYVAQAFGTVDVSLNDRIFETQKKLMYDEQTKMFSRRNPDGETWNAKTYEIVRFLG